MLLKQSTARNVMVLMIDSTDHISGKTGLTLTITASKDGAAFASITPSVTERGDGWYSLALTTSHTDTLGDLALHITGSGADATDRSWMVVSKLPGDDVTVSSGTGAGQISLSSGQVTVGTNNDKTGYTASTVTDKTGYSISGTKTTLDALNDVSLAGVNAECDTALSDYGALKPTVAGRTLDVSATGEAGLDWANIGSPGTAQNLSLTQIESVNGNVEGQVTGSVGSVAGNVLGSVQGTVAGVNGDINGHVLGNVNGSTASVTGAVGSVTGNVGGNVVGSVGSVTGHTPQTGDTYALANGASGFVAIKGETALILADTGTDGVVISSTTQTAIADALLKRDMSAVTGEASRSPINAIRLLRNKWSVSGGTLTVTKEDDTTSAWTAAVTGDAAADPIVASDPA